MNENLINTILLSGCFLFLFGIAELLYHFAGVKAELTRKLVHLITGLLTLSFPPLLENHWYVLGICASFLLLLVLSLQFKMLPSINAVDRVTRGSFLYPVIVYFCFLAQNAQGNLIYYYLPILILAFCDPVAALVGKSRPWLRYSILGQSKTISGSLGFFVAALVISSILLSTFMLLPVNTLILLVLVVSFASTLAEALTQKGYDNLSIPLTTLSVLFTFENFFS